VGIDHCILQLAVGLVHSLEGRGETFEMWGDGAIVRTEKG
jgi:hypothetical protein